MHIHIICIIYIYMYIHIICLSHRYIYIYTYYMSVTYTCIYRDATMSLKMIFLWMSYKYLPHVERCRQTRDNFQDMRHQTKFIMYHPQLQPPLLTHTHTNKQTNKSGVMTKFHRHPHQHPAQDCNDNSRQEETDRFLVIDMPNVHSTFVSFSRDSSHWSSSTSESVSPRFQSERPEN